MVIHTNSEIIDFSFILNHFHYFIILFIVETHKDYNSRVDLPPKSSKNFKKSNKIYFKHGQLCELRPNAKEFSKHCQIVLKCINLKNSN